MKHKQTYGSAGNSGGKVRSDCLVEIGCRESGGITINLISKVSSMYGDEIKSQVREMLLSFGLSDALVTVSDSGALPWVIAARTEAAIRQILDTDHSFMQPESCHHHTATAKDVRRFSRLYLPGNSPSLMINAFLHRPDGLILDLEDSVAPQRKAEARILVRNALRSLDFGNSERMVRINQLPEGLSDLDWIIPYGVDLVLLPKCESAHEVHAVENRIGEILKNNGLSGPVWIMPIIESAKGVVKSYEIASSATSVAALAIGLEDYTADLGVKRTRDGSESLYARSVLVNSAKAAGIQAIDSVFSDIEDMDGLAANVQRSRALGFDGMGCIHPRQIAVIHENFAPDPDDIDKAQKIMIAFTEAQEKGLGVVALGSKMIDAPVVKRARRTIEQAIELGLIESNWNQNLAK